MKNKIDNQNGLIYKIFPSLLIKIIIWSISFPFVTVIINLIVGFIIDNLDFQFAYNKMPSLYSFFRSLYYGANTYLTYFLVIIWFIGVMILVYNSLKKYNLYITSLTKGAEELIGSDTEYIELMPELAEFENKLNHLKRESEKSKRLAKESEQRKNDLIVYLAHDLKTPLTSVIGYLSLLEEIQDMPKKKREKYIKIALEKSYHLEELINELFDIARFNSETIVLEKEEINLNLMIEQIIDEFYPVIKENDKEIIFDKKAKVILWGDPNKLARAFSNLIKNAINYSTDKIIKISIKDEENVTVVISNKGKKIPKEKLNKLFEKFYRGDTSRNSKTGGSGLGLAIAKEIIELHHGNITAESDDEYTRFYVELPKYHL